MNMNFDGNLDSSRSGFDYTVGTKCPHKNSKPEITNIMGQPMVPMRKMAQ